MPKAAPYRLTWDSEQEVYTLRDNSSKRKLPVTPDSQEWFALLANIPSFTFSGQHGQLTVRQETRPGGGAYWYAYRRTGKRMVKKYLGRTLELTLALLEEVAREIAASSAFHSKQEPLARDPSLEQAYHSSQAYLSSPTPSTVSEAFRSSPKSRPVWKMPTLLTPFIGRQQEVAAICALLSRPEVRMLTLWGTGGIGKTRLAIEAAGIMRTSFADGVCFVGLAPIRDPNLVMPTIARALSIQKTAERSLIEQMQATLREKHLLLVLDNLEQIVTSTPAVEELLLACPYVKVLVTSRAVLRLQAERLFLVPPLTLPDLNKLPEYEVLVRYAAIALFQQHAQAVTPTFRISPANVQVIAEICVRLDGLPLAIELAAARIRLLSAQALLSRLMSRLQMLTGGARTLPTRQQTLRNTLQWSYDLLEAQEQQLFRRLSIFVGGCELSAVEALCREVGDQTTDVLNIIASLLDNSFVQRVEQADNEPRFMMLETMREFGLEALAASGEMETIRQAHAAYYLGLAEEAEPEWEGPQQAVWSERLEREHDNVRAVMLWSLERGETGHDWELSLRLGGALRRFWQVRGYLNEGRAFLEQVLAASAGVVSAGRIKALIAMGHVAVIQSDYDRVEAACKEGLALCQKLGDTAGSASTLYLLGWIAWMRGDLISARSLIEQTVELFKQIGDKSGLA